MQPSSRTPEGSPNRCPVCGNEVTLEPSIPPGDAPCPFCNSLLWFDERARAQGASRDAIEKTKQHIRVLVEEIATLSKTERDLDEFFPGFLQRVVRALAAVGGAVWLLGTNRQLELVYEINVPSVLLDRISEESEQHYRLLDHVVRGNKEYIVPLWWGGAAKWQGGNPTQQLLLLNPLRCRPESAVGLVEIFQRPNTAQPTQRGYSVFLKQMSEFGSAFLARTSQAL